MSATNTARPTPHSSRRRWVRLSLRSLALLVVIAGFALAALLALPSARARPGTSDRYLKELVTLAETRRASGEDAWPRYVEISEALDASVPGDRSDDPIERIWSAPFDEAQSPADLEALESVRPLADQVILASTLPRCATPPDPWSTDLPGAENFGAGSQALDALGGMNPSIVTRRLLSLLRAEMRCAAADARWDRVAECLAAALRLSNHVHTAPLSISVVILAGQRAQAPFDLRLLTANLSLPPAACDALAAAIDAVPPPPGAALAAIDGECLYALHALNDVYADNGLALVWALDRQDDVEWLFGAGSPIAGPPTIGERAFNVRAYFSPRRPAAERAVREYHAALGAWVSPTSSARAEFPLIPERVTSFRVTRDWSPIGFAPSRVFARGVHLLDEAPAATRVCLLLAKHRAVHGVWPDTLSAADADSPNPVTGEAFFYQPTPEGPAPFRLARSRDTSPQAAGDYTPIRPSADSATPPIDDE